MLDLASLRPMMATAAPLPQDDAAYAFEFKWDGMRVLAGVAGGRVEAVSRNGKEAAARFPELRALAGALRGREAILDAEVVSLDARGRPDFGLMQDRMHLANPREIQQAAAAHPVEVLAFDLLQLDGRELLREPYEERRRLLLGLGVEGEGLGVPPHQVGAGAAVLEASRTLGLEGVVAKALGSPYLPGARSPHWLKVRNRLRQEFVVGGWTEGERSRAGTVGSLLLGVYGSPEGPDRLRYVGKTGTGLGAKMLSLLERRLKSLAQSASPFDSGADGMVDAAARFVRPELVCEVEFSGVTHHRVLRQASFKGLRDDKPAREVVWEQADVNPWSGPSGADPSASVS